MNNVQVKRWLKGWGITNNRKWFFYYYKSKDDAFKVAHKMLERGDEIIKVNINRARPVTLIDVSNGSGIDE